jgi:hypothetical protein
MEVKMDKTLYCNTCGYYDKAMDFDERTFRRCPTCNTMLVINPTIIELYLKERNYQTNVFGNNPSFNVASFLEFLSVYIDKAKKSYVEKWDSELPKWLETCKESEEQNTAPVSTYGYLIKIMALAGQALELYTQTNSTEWRKEGVKEKWIKKPE